ncbi:MAG TPA: ImmA/IrrE family metallo-endopeptidase [Leptolyngbyaceae cyanobacterium]
MAHDISRSTESLRIILYVPKLTLVDRDLTFLEIEKAFLDFVEDFHAQRDYRQDFIGIAQKHGIKICVSKQNQAFNIGEERVILINPNTGYRRFAFTGWHELSHHLFKEAQNGDLEAFLFECVNGDLEQQRQLEEDLCFKAAALLLMPSHILHEVIAQEGYSPLAVFELAERTGASIEAAMRRVVWSRSTDNHAVLMQDDGYVLSSAGSGRRANFCVGYQFFIKEDHPLRARPFSPLKEERFEAPVPFKRSSQVWKSKVVAAANSDCSRILAFFLNQYLTESPGQIPLF